MLVLGCRSGDGGPAVGAASARTPPAAADMPCVPSLHDRAETRLPGPGFEAYRLVGGSRNGRRVAMVVTHIGPGSGAPVGGLHIAEAGAPGSVLDKRYFTAGGIAADLAGVERGLVDDNAAEIAAAGVEVGANLPVPQPWCADPAGRIFLASGRELRLEVMRPPCEDDPAHHSVAWQVCAVEGGSACVRASPRGCLDGTPTVRNLYRLGTIDWVVVDLATQPFSGIDFHLRQVAGGSLTGS
jgi:hypothetical protein